MEEETAGSDEDSEIIWQASSKAPSLTFAINSGIRTITGQPPTQGLFLQFKHLSASSIACSGV